MTYGQGILVHKDHGGVAAKLGRFRAETHDGMLKLRVLLDRWGMELFANGGEQAAACVLYTPQETLDIAFSADGSAINFTKPIDNVRIRGYTYRNLKKARRTAYD